MNSRHLIKLVLLLVTILSSCEKDDIITESISPIIETDLPESGKVGQEIVINVSHAVYNGCGYYSSQRTIQNGKTLTVTFNAKYREGFCTMNIPILKTQYKFTLSNSGTYTFRFNSGQGDFLTQTITID